MPWNGGTQGTAARRAPSGGRCSHPVRSVPLAFLAVIILGAGLLMLPVVPHRSTMPTS